MADTGNRGPLTPQHPSQNPGNDAQAAEQKMRRALGLNSSGSGHTVQQRPEQARARHRFVQDGGVPVTVLNHRVDDSGALKERVSELQNALETERNQHANTRRALAEQQAAVQALQTRIAHNDLAHADALANERRALATAQAALAEALAAPPQRAPRPKPTYVRSEPIPAQADEPEAPAETRADAQTPATEPDPATPPRKRGRPRSTTPPEPKPVRWWTPSFRAKTKR